MKRSTKYFVLLILIFCGFIGYSAYRSCKVAEESATLSRLYSMSNEINLAISQNRFKVENQPRELTQSEVEQLLKQIKAGDCGGVQLSSEQIHIAVGDVNKENSLIKIKIWTNGYDGIAGTDDDVVMPWGEKSY